MPVVEETLPGGAQRVTAGPQSQGQLEGTDSKRAYFLSQTDISQTDFQVLFLSRIEPTLKNSL